MSVFRTRKSVHINLTRDTHTAFKIFAFKQGLSMQEIFEELASKAIEDDPSVLAIVSELKEKKKNKEVSRITAVDADTIYDVINSGD